MTNPRRTGSAASRPGIRTAGRLVAAARGERGWTQAQVAVFAGVGIRTVGDLEGGHKWPWAKNLAAIAKVLGLDATELERVADGNEPAKAGSL